MKIPILIVLTDMNFVISLYDGLDTHYLQADGGHGQYTPTRARN
jgi:hypothetical protein